MPEDTQRSEPSTGRTQLTRVPRREKFPRAAASAPVSARRAIGALGGSIKVRRQAQTGSFLAPILEKGCLRNGVRTKQPNHVADVHLLDVFAIVGPLGFFSLQHKADFQSNAMWPLESYQLSRANDSRYVRISKSRGGDGNVGFPQGRDHHHPSLELGQFVE